MIKSFFKMHGIGNDYIYFDCRKEMIKDPWKAARELSNRHFSIGGDGIVLVCPSEIADAKMRIFNADGSEAKMCGNATRCVGKLMHDFLEFNKDEIFLETLSGIKKIKLNIEEGRVTAASVDMGRVSFEPSLIPIKSSDEYINRETIVDGISFHTTCLSVGNPHAVTEVASPNDFDLAHFGPLFETNPLFPERVNAEFIKIHSDNHIEMRVWERGSGETLACGTGATAVAAAAVMLGKCGFNSPIRVSLLGGDLTIIIKSDWSATMIGPASLAFIGRVDSEYL